MMFVFWLRLTMFHYFWLRLTDRTCMYTTNMTKQCDSLELRICIYLFNRNLDLSLYPYKDVCFLFSLTCLFSLTTFALPPCLLSLSHFSISGRGQTQQPRLPLYPYQHNHYSNFWYPTPSPPPRITARPWPPHTATFLVFQNQKV